jgi:hypothetical protein
LSFLAEARPELVERLAALEFENGQASKLSIPTTARAFPQNSENFFSSWEAQSA